MPDGSVKDVPLGELVVDDKVLIKPGEKVPADGVIVAGESPVAKKTGGKVLAGPSKGKARLRSRSRAPARTRSCRRSATSSNRRNRRSIDV